MEKQPIAHATIVLERDISASADRVFAALADPRERASWGVPSDTAVLIYDATDFRVGGADHFRCGSRDDPKFHGHTVYTAIVPGQSIVSSETVTVGGTCLSGSASV